MLPYTLDNHFSYGYGDGLFDTVHKSPQADLWCTYSRCAREPGNFREECVRTAKKISEDCAKIGRIPYLMLSGGLDSEVMVKAFIQAEVQFKIITFRFKDGLNEHEIRHVKMFAAANKLDVIWYDIDALKFIASDEARDLLDKSHGVSCGMVCHMKLMNHIWFDLGGAPCLGNGDVHFEKRDGLWSYVELEYMLAWFRHAVSWGVLGGIGFFQYTPEIALAMLCEPKIERLGKNQDLFATKHYSTSRWIKYSIYLKHWPELKTRPKFGGQELVLTEFRARSEEIMQDRPVLHLDKFWIPYAEFRAMLEPARD